MRMRIVIVIVNVIFIVIVIGIVIVIVIVIVIIIVMAIIIIKVVGGTVNLPCEAVGTPTPKLSWTYRGVSVLSDEKFIVQPGKEIMYTLCT